MSLQNYLNILSAADNPVLFEAPSSFDRKTADIKFLKLVEEVKKLFGQGCNFEYGILIQDASFHGEIGLPTELRLNNEPIVIRTSNFGNFSTIYSHSGEVSKEIVEKSIKCFQSLGYQYIPYEILMEAYTGKFTKLAHPSWWFRYFDYL